MLTENCKESVQSKLLFRRGEGEATYLAGTRGRGLAPSGRSCSPQQLVGLQPPGGQQLPRCSAWVPWPGFQASRLKGTKW